MLGMLKSSMEEVKMRFKKPAIVSGVIIAIIIGVVIKQGNLGKFLGQDLGQTLLLYCMFAGIWYGRYIIFFGGQAPINENTGEPYYPGGFNGSVFRWVFAIAIGATVGAFFFVIDAIRIIADAVKKVIQK